MAEKTASNTRIYTSQTESLFKSPSLGIGELWVYRELLFALVNRDIAVRYKQSVLGVAWAIFTPLMMMIIFSLIVANGIINVNTGGIPYPIFVFCGFLPWTFFQSAMNEGTQSLTQNINLITKVYLPKEVFPLSVILGKLFDLALSALVLVALMAYYRYVPHWTTIFLLPVLAIQIVFTTGLILILSMSNLFYRDVKKIVEVIVFLWMFASNVIYPIPTGNRIGFILSYINPMIPFIDSYRSLMLRGTLDQPNQLIAASAVSAILLFVGLSVFRKYEHLFAERI